MNKNGPNLCGPDDWEPVVQYKLIPDLPDVMTNTARLRVPGGWIYQTYAGHYRDYFVTTVFVPEPPQSATNK